MTLFFISFYYFCHKSISTRSKIHRIQKWCKMLKIQKTHKKLAHHIHLSSAGIHLSLLSHVPHGTQLLYNHFLLNIHIIYNYIFHTSLFCIITMHYTISSILYPLLYAYQSFCVAEFTYPYLYSPVPTNSPYHLFIYHTPPLYSFILMSTSRL